MMCVLSMLLELKHFYFSHAHQVSVIVLLLVFQCFLVSYYSYWLYVNCVNHFSRQKKQTETTFFGFNVMWFS